jgi:hypothetical protein
MPCLLDSSHTFEEEGVNVNVIADDMFKIDANRRDGSRTAQSQIFLGNHAIVTSTAAFRRVPSSHAIVVLTRKTNKFVAFIACAARLTRLRSPRLLPNLTSVFVSEKRRQGCTQGSRWRRPRGSRGVRRCLLPGPGYTGALSKTEKRSQVSDFPNRRATVATRCPG